MSAGLPEFPGPVPTATALMRTATVPVVGADGAYALLELRVPAGTAVPPLAHVGVTVLVVLAGELSVVRADGRRALGVGEGTLIAANEPCRITVEADAHLLCLVTPAGLDALLDLLSGPVGDRDDLAARLAAAGVTLLPAGWGAAS